MHMQEIESTTPQSMTLLCWKVERGEAASVCNEWCLGTVSLHLEYFTCNGIKSVH